MITLANVLPASMAKTVKEISMIAILIPVPMVPRAKTKSILSSVNANQDGRVIYARLTLMTVLVTLVKREYVSMVLELTLVNAIRDGKVKIARVTFDAILTLVRMEAHADQSMMEQILLVIVWATGWDRCVQ